MHAKCLNEIQQSMIHSHNSGSNQLKMLKSCCYLSLKDLCDHKDGTWWKMKKYSHQKDIINYPDGCIICLKSFSVGCVSAVKRATQIIKMEEDENDEGRIECMVCLLQVIFILWSKTISQFVFLCCTPQCILSGSSGYIPIDPSKISYCFWTSTAISLRLNVFLSFLHSNRTICKVFSYLHSLIRIQWRDISQSWKHR